ncbi:uncharacterized protein LAESUDRAFT_429265 [Laetiporus sulphureus 93-53]|uniref:Secreted protein n=1 Tax=Laetiporus sulphureus 93-53 TaxID=1314785 RepID=A0A165GM19_9APHY|nr:uncharacterized protein LAESUDRAFT_429265 [Laetiporus sulphureus 93-53]KZT10537.1 hypothetical protein LAESUDRAFT_429265 [Laetiporus sulphureus 93-53]
MINLLCIYISLELAVVLPCSCAVQYSWDIVCEMLLRRMLSNLCVSGCCAGIIDKRRKNSHLYIAHYHSCVRMAERHNTIIFSCKGQGNIAFAVLQLQHSDSMEPNLRM